MKRIREDILSLKRSFVKCVPTNKVVKRNGDGVMGAGAAWAVRNRFPQAEAALGNFLQKNRDDVGTFLEVAGYKLIAFPTKNHFRYPSNLPLVEQSAHKLRQYLGENDLVGVPVALPIPGVGYGGLERFDVIPIIERILGDTQTYLIYK